MTALAIRPAWQPRSHEPGRFVRPYVRSAIEVVLDLDGSTNEAVLLVHWVGGRHSELRVARVKAGCYPKDNIPTALEGLRKLAGRWPNKDLAVSLNRRLNKTTDGEPWTTVPVRERRECLGLSAYDGKNDSYILLAKAAERSGICIRSACRLAETGLLPGRLMTKGSPWLIPAAALDDENVQTESCRKISVAVAECEPSEVLFLGDIASDRDRLQSFMFAYPSNRVRFLQSAQNGWKRLDDLL